MNILSGDIGGTKTILAIHSSQTGPRHPLIEKSYPSSRYASLEDIIREFLAEVQIPVEGACFGVAGPVFSGRAQITNLSWVIDGSTIEDSFGWSGVTILNDLESVAFGILTLKPEDTFTLSAGSPVPHGSIAVLAPGTGLGEAYLTYDNGCYHAHASEGGHASFGPVGELQIGLLTYLNRLGFEHVSYERVCSGRLGIPHLYDYLKTTGLEEPQWLAEQLATSEDPTPIIFAAAHDQDRPCLLALKVLEMFVAILGAEAGNLALKVLATGGIYLTGGMSPRILADLQKPAFLDALRSKGRFQELLARVPVHVILNSKVGLLGAAACGLARIKP